MSQKLEVPSPISFDWNKGNIDKNEIKRKVDFRECEEVFMNRPLKILKDIKHSQNEIRYIALGQTDNKRYLIIIFTIRKSKIRVVSARNQSRKERNLYEKK